MIQKIVAGNTIHLKWTVMKNSNMIIQDAHVILQDVFKKQVPFEYTIQDNGTELVISGKYEGKDQRTFIRRKRPKNIWQIQHHIV